MGKLLTPVKAPTIQTVRVPAVTRETTSPKSNGEGSTSSGEDVTSDVSSSKARAENLLRRSRGRFGTVITGFNGVLEAADTRSKRKTLLGE